MYLFYSMDKINILIYILILLFIGLLVYYFYEKGKLLEGMTSNTCNTKLDLSNFFTSIGDSKPLNSFSPAINNSLVYNITVNNFSTGNKYWSYTFDSGRTIRELTSNSINTNRINQLLSSKLYDKGLQKTNSTVNYFNIIQDSNNLNHLNISPDFSQFEKINMPLSNYTISFYVNNKNGSKVLMTSSVTDKCTGSSPSPNDSSNTPPPAPSPSPSSCSSYFTDSSNNGSTYNYIIQPNKLEVSDYVYVSSSNQSGNEISHVTLTLTMNNLLEATNLYTSIYKNNSPKNITFYVATTTTESINNTFYNSNISKNKEVILSKKWVNPLKLAVPPIYNTNGDPTTFLNQSGNNIFIKIAASANSKEFILNNPLIGISSTEKMDTMNSLLYGCISPSPATTSSSSPAPTSFATTSSSSPAPTSSPYTYIIDQIDNCPNNDRFEIYFDDGTTSKSYIKLYSTRGSIGIINTTNKEDAQKFYFCQVKLSSESTISMVLTDFNGKKYYLRAFSGLKIEPIDELTTISKTVFDSELDFSDAKTLKKFTREYNEKMIKFIISALNNNSPGSSPVENSGSTSPSCPDQKNSNYVYGLPLLNIHHSNINKVLQ
mgnify:CR=1 FL=1